MKITIILLVFFGQLMTNIFGQVSHGEKICGLHYVTLKKALNRIDLTSVEGLGANWVSIVPFSYMCNLKSTTLDCEQIKHHVGDEMESVRRNIRFIQLNSKKTMVKPQIFLGEHKYVGHINYLKRSQWRAFENSYTEMILSYAQLCEEENVDLFCIGTELTSFVQKRNRYWRSLIKSIRKIYSGKITYAANWDSYNTISFWGELDYIGIDAYFPIAKNDDESLEDLKSGWLIYTNKMKGISDQYQKKIIFTEYGYRSHKNCAIKPWEHKKKTDSVNEEAQSLALQALYESIWSQDYFSGGFLWHWKLNPAFVGGPNDADFTVQNKKAENVVRKCYTKTIP